MQSWCRSGRSGITLWVTVIAQNAKPAAFKGRILLVHVNSSTWIHQLQFLKKEMIAKLNDTLGKTLIEDLKFKIGPLGKMIED